MTAYCQGVFPMANEDGDIFWYDPNPRAILPLDDFHVSRSLQRKVRKTNYEIRINSSFPAVIRACAQLAEGRESTWINDEIIRAYIELHSLGYAHSVETWMDEELVGGLYGVAINGFFAGESMFSRRQDTSKLALVYLAEHLQHQNFLLLDVQFMTEHLRRFGAVEIPREAYHTQLARAIMLPVSF